MYPFITYRDTVPCPLSWLYPKSRSGTSGTWSWFLTFPKLSYDFCFLNSVMCSECKLIWFFGNGLILKSPPLVWKFIGQSVFVFKLRIIVCNRTGYAKQFQWFPTEQRINWSKKCKKKYKKIFIWHFLEDIWTQINLPFNMLKLFCKACSFCIQ